MADLAKRASGKDCEKTLVLDVDDDEHHRKNGKHHKGK
jgi:hypothetical protein